MQPEHLLGWTESKLLVSTFDPKQIIVSLVLPRISSNLGDITGIHPLDSTSVHEYVSYLLKCLILNQALKSCE